MRRMLIPGVYCNTENKAQGLINTERIIHTQSKWFLKKDPALSKPWRNWHPVALARGGGGGGGGERLTAANDARRGGSRHADRTADLVFVDLGRISSHLSKYPFVPREEGRCWPQYTEKNGSSGSPDQNFHGILGVRECGSSRREQNVGARVQTSPRERPPARREEGKMFKP